NLLMGLTERMEGAITDGVQRLSLKSSVSCILQDFAQYQMTIKENVSAGRPDGPCTDEEVERLLEQTGLLEFLRSLERGIHTPLGQLDHGIELSKGQWQRLAVARLLAHPNASVWILDEPTAYLDPMAEIEMYQLIHRLAGD